MAVYIINNMTIHDRAAYDKYASGFMPIFSRYRGEILAISDKPPAIEGEWPFDRTVLLRFPAMTLKIVAAIHWQALLIFLRHNPVYDHPGHDHPGKTSRT